MKIQAQAITLVDSLRPASWQKTWLYDLAVIVGGSLVIALFAQLALYLPISPVPITGQTLAVLLIGAMLGSKRGAACVLLYLAEGAIGLPFFAGGASSIAIFFAAGKLAVTGGYLIGFVPAAFLTGWLAERDWDRKPNTTALAMLLGNAVIYAFGLPWLAIALGSEVVTAGGGLLALGFMPFIVGDLLKLILAMALLPSGWSLIANLRSREEKS